MRAMIGDLRSMPFDAMRFSTAEDRWALTVFGAKSLTADSLQPTSTSGAATVAKRNVARATLASIGLSGRLLSHEPGPATGRFHQRRHGRPVNLEISLPQALSPSHLAALSNSQ